MKYCVSVNVVIAVLVLLFSIGSSGSHHKPSLYRLKRQSPCSAQEFKCTNNECISSYNVCDGAKDCSDGSDETKPTCENIRCPPRSFNCSYGACIDKALRCNGKPDCADSSDEEGCDESVPNSNCKSGNFKCTNGECVDKYSACDGTKDCSDGSDETQQNCQNLICPPNSFQCKYGACLDKKVKCNGISECHDGSDENEESCPATISDRPELPQDGCLLPEQPSHGVYESTMCQVGDPEPRCRNTPGTPVPNNWLLKYSCDANYNISSGSNKFSVCYNGDWSTRLKCIKLCHPLQSQSVEVHCTYEGREVACDHPMKPNTSATATCKPHYTESGGEDFPHLLCLPSGEWSNQLISCKPVCGTQSGPLIPLIQNGEPTELGKFPWLAAIFLKDKGTDLWSQQCGGTLISPHIVLTAAHCVVFAEGVLNPEEVKVGLGKLYRDFYRQEETALIVNVTNILKPDNYHGASASYTLDIALLDLEISVQMTAVIRPACVDWSFRFTFPSNIGYVAGWGKTENGASSEKMLSTQLHYYNYNSCIRKVKRTHNKALLTLDKFCAKISKNGGQVDRGDSGGGLTTLKNDLHFVIGIVSTKIIDQDNYSFFTNISNVIHSSWLIRSKTILDSKN